MESYIILITILFLAFLLIIVFNYRRERQLLKQRIRNNWGQVPTTEYNSEEFASISNYFRIRKDKEDFHIDDITWNDLDMDSIFLMMAHTYSSVGDEYLYNMLRVPSMDQEELKERERLIKLFSEQKEKSLSIQECFAGIGRMRNVSLTQYIQQFTLLPKKSPLIHYLHLILLVAGFIALFNIPQIGIMVLIAAMGVNIVQYYRYKAKVEVYFKCIQKILYMLACSERLKKFCTDDLLKPYLDDLLKVQKALRPVKYYAKAVVLGSDMTGSPADVLFEYLRMITHMDLIAFDKIVMVIKDKTDIVFKMFDTLGKLESFVALASFRSSLVWYAVPEFLPEGQPLSIEKGYHPMIDEPVPLSLATDKGVLITGANASGKSTFLKMMGLNVILAQTVSTVLAEAYQAPFYRVYSSMALKDNLLGKESYYMVEIKSLKRIIDAVLKKGPRVLCFVDEVLRGTNTIERIAASSIILKLLSEEGALTFAATHDIELTYLLEKIYVNYHFKEEVSEGDIWFTYQLHYGRATTRNAIKLLTLMGYSKALTNEAEEVAERFVKEGVWRF